MGGNLTIAISIPSPIIMGSYFVSRALKPLSKTVKSSEWFVALTISLVHFLFMLDFHQRFGWKLYTRPHTYTTSYLPKYSTFKHPRSHSTTVNPHTIIFVCSDVHAILTYPSLNKINSPLVLFGVYSWDTPPIFAAIDVTIPLPGEYICLDMSHLTNIASHSMSPYHQPHILFLRIPSRTHTPLHITTTPTKILPNYLIP